ncbi:hypothetical protein Tco_0557499, partial [Tanacetum coccineum]
VARRESFSASTISTLFLKPSTPPVWATLADAPVCPVLPPRVGLVSSSRSLQEKQLKRREL